MIIPVNPGANSKGIVINTVAGASRLLLQNPAAAAGNLYFHQGLGLKYGEVLSATPAAAVTTWTAVAETGSGTLVLEPGESIELNFSRPVWVYPATNISTTVNATPLA